MQMSVGALLASGALRVHTQRQASSTSLASITLTRHVTLYVIEVRASAGQCIRTEALSAILRASHAISFSLAISNTLRIGNLMVPNISELNTSHDAVTIAERVGIAAEV